MKLDQCGKRVHDDPERGVVHDDCRIHATEKDAGTKTHAFVLLGARNMYNGGRQIHDRQRACKLLAGDERRKIRAALQHVGNDPPVDFFDRVISLRFSGAVQDDISYHPVDPDVAVLRDPGDMLHKHQVRTAVEDRRRFGSRGFRLEHVECNTSQVSGPLWMRQAPIRRQCRPAPC